jgi:hypothetical protein
MNLLGNTIEDITVCLLTHVSLEYLGVIATLEHPECIDQAV